MNISDSVLHCSVKRKGDSYEGTVTLPGLRPTKLVKKDSTSVYANRNGVASAAKTLADRLNLKLEIQDPTSQTSTKTKTVVKSKKTTSANPVACSTNSNF